MKVLLKLSGQVLKGDQSVIDRTYLRSLATVLKSAQDNGHQVAIVVGGGNLFRFFKDRRLTEDEKLDKVLADGRGMLSTVFNGMWLQDIFQACDVRSQLFTNAFADEQFVKLFDSTKAKAALEQGDVVILAGGTGKPGFSTDSGAVMQASELGIDTILKGTHTVDGIYSADPLINPNAKRFDQLKYSDAIEQNLAIMDQTAIERARDENMRIVVFSMQDPNSLTKLLDGETIGSIIES